MPESIVFQPSRRYPGYVDVWSDGKKVALINPAKGDAVTRYSGTQSVNNAWSKRVFGMDLASLQDLYRREMGRDVQTAGAR